jgi:hypothetical protein
VEFFTVAGVSTTEDWLQAQITIAKLPDFCYTIAVIAGTEERGRIDTVWGKFEVTRQAIKGGVRLTLTTCPNALAWTITTGYPPIPEQEVIHCTINRTAQSQDFIESIKEFVADWQAGLEQKIVTNSCASLPQ